MDSPPRHDILLDPCSRCTVFVNTAGTSPKLGIASSQARLLHYGSSFYSCLVMACVHPDGNKPPDRTKRIIGQFNLSLLGIGCPALCIHALSVVADGITVEPTLDKSERITRPTHQLLMMEHRWHLFQILRGQGTRTMRHMPGRGASVVPVTSRLDVQRGQRAKGQRTRMSRLLVSRKL